MLLFSILFYLVVFVVIMFFAVKLAPFGYEDGEGFHYIKN